MAVDFYFFKCRHLIFNIIAGILQYYVTAKTCLKNEKVNLIYVMSGYQLQLQSPEMRIWWTAVFNALVLSLQL